MWKFSLFLNILVWVPLKISLKPNMHAVALLQEAGTQSNHRVREKRELSREGRKTTKGSVLPMLSFSRMHICLLSQEVASGIIQKHHL